MKQKLILLIGIICGPSTALMAQTVKESPAILTAEQLIQQVKKHHPVAKQANIIVEKAKAEVLAARSGFDPLFRNETGQKSFAGDMYYYYNRPQLTIPTWGGVEITAGTHYLSGVKTDPEDTKGASNFWGVSLPLAKDLLMDKRRAVLRTAQIYREASELERKSLINDLLLDALKVYWQWSQYYHAYRIMNEAITVNQARVQMVRTSFKLGDRPAIDTVEAITQLQNLELQRNQAWMDFQNAGLELSVFLWNEYMEPGKLDPYTIPDDSKDQNENLIGTLVNLLETTRSNHPELLLYPFKLKALDVEKKWKFQDLLPEARFYYNQLGKGFNLPETGINNLFGMNYQYGLSVGFPLRLSKGRAEYRKAKLKITETRLQQSNKQVIVEMKVRTIFNEWQTLGSQVALQEKACSNYYALQRAEETRFRAGESSLFLINARENKTLEALLKLQELKAKYRLAAYKLLWAMGTLE